MFRPSADVDHFLFSPRGVMYRALRCTSLLLATSLGFANRLRHRRRDFIAIQNRFTVNVTRRASYGSNQERRSAGSPLYRRPESPPARPPAYPALRAAG